MYLVTGGAGFIGSNLVAALCARGAEVLVCDRLRAGEKWRNLAHHPIAGMLPPEQLEGFLATHPRLAAVVHLGAVSDTTVRDGDLVVASNLALTLRLWAWCAAAGVPLIYASSAATYGDGADGFADAFGVAELARLRPLNLYGWSKHATDRRIAQLLARNASSGASAHLHARAAPPQWAGLKFFNVYGPNEYHKGRMASVAFHKFQQIRRGERATLFASDRADVGDGEQRRDFVHVDDCVAAMLWLLDTPRVSGLFNIGSGKARSFAELTRAVYAAMGREAEIDYVPMPQDLRGKYQYFTEAPMAKLRTAGFDTPPTTLEEGVRRYVQDFLLREADPYR